MRQEYIESLLNELKNESPLSVYLKTNMNLYSAVFNINDIRPLLLPIENYISEKEYKRYNVLEEQRDVMYFIDSTMPEYESVNDLENAYILMESPQVDGVVLRNIKNERIQLVIIKKNNFLLVYRYTAAKLFKQKFAMFFGEDVTYVRQNDEAILALTKELPDLIFDYNNKIAHILNVTQTEYILNINSLFQASINHLASVLLHQSIMDQECIDLFLSSIEDKNRYKRKIHKISTMQSYTHFKSNLTRIPEVIVAYDLSVNFCPNTNKIIFDEETDVSDVLHLLADDYIIRFISNLPDVLD